MAAYKKTVDPVKEFKPASHRPAYRPSKPVPAVKVCALVCWCAYSGMYLLHYSSPSLSSPPLPKPRT